MEMVHSSFVRRESWIDMRGGAKLDLDLDIEREEILPSLGTLVDPQSLDVPRSWKIRKFRNDVHDYESTPSSIRV